MRAKEAGAVGATDESGTRDRLIRAAIRLCEQRSLHEVTIREIYETAGVRNGSAVRYYFGDKEGLGRAILETLTDEIIEPAKQRLRELKKRSNHTPYSVEDIVLAILSPSLEIVAKPEFGWSAPRAFPRLMRDVGPEVREVFSRSARALIRSACEMLDLILPDATLPEIQLRLYMTFTVGMHLVDDLFSVFGLKRLPSGASELESLISAAADYMTTGLKGNARAQR